MKGFFEICYEKLPIDMNLKKVKKISNWREKYRNLVQGQNAIIMCTISPKVILMYEKVYRTNWKGFMISFMKNYRSIWIWKKLKKKINNWREKYRNLVQGKNTLMMCTISPKVILMYKKVYRTNWKGFLKYLMKNYRSIRIWKKNKKNENWKEKYRNLVQG